MGSVKVGQNAVSQARISSARAMRTLYSTELSKIAWTAAASPLRPRSITAIQARRSSRLRFLQPNSDAMVVQKPTDFVDLAKRHMIYGQAGLSVETRKGFLVVYRSSAFPSFVRIKRNRHFIVNGFKVLRGAMPVNKWTPNQTVNVSPSAMDRRAMHHAVFVSANWSWAASRSAKTRSRSAWDIISECHAKFLLHRTVQNCLDGSGIGFTTEVDNSDIRPTVHRDCVFFKRMADAVTVEEPSDLRPPG